MPAEYLTHRVVEACEGAGSGVLLIWLATTTSSIKNLNLNWISWAILVVLLLWIGLTKYLSKLGCSDIEGGEVLIRLPDG